MNYNIVAFSLLSSLINENLINLSNMSCDISKFISIAKYTQSFSASSTVAVVVSNHSSSLALGFNFNEQTPLITSSKVLDLISVTTGDAVVVGAPSSSS